MSDCEKTREEEAISVLEKNLEKAQAIAERDNLAGAEIDIGLHVTEALSIVDDYEEKGIISNETARNMRIKYVDAERKFFLRYNRIKPTPFNDL